MRHFGLLMIVAGLATAAEPVKPTMIELKANTLGAAVEEFNKLTGESRKVTEEKKNLAFQHEVKNTYWQHVTAIEKAMGNTLVTSADGAFRLELKKINSRMEFESQRTETQWTFELQWEPKVPVLMMDAEPTVTKAEIKQVKPEFSKPSGKLLTKGSSQQVVLKATGIPRTATSVDDLQLTLEVVAAQKWLNLEFTDLTKTTDTKAEIEGVSAVCQPVKSKEKRTEFSLSLTYPKDHPEFESFQQWAVGNRLQLVSPDGSKVVDCHPDDSSVDSDGRNVRAVYSFPKTGSRGVDGGDWKGWKLRYRTPGPMVVQKLNFTFKDVPLP
jgi:hypothetical protein